MQLRAIFISLIGLGLAGVSAWFASELISPRATATTQPIQTEFVKVLTAKTDIQFGQIIDRELLSTQSWPAGSIPKGAFTGTRALLGPEDASPRRATQLIRQGELIVESAVSDFGETVTIVQSLGTNTRAMSIEVDAVTAVGGFVMPGDRVDIVLTEGRGRTLRAATILQDVRVLGIDQFTTKDGKATRGARTITVEISPRDGQILALGQRAGVLSLTLRTQNDVTDSVLEQITLSDLLDDAEPVDVPVPVVAEVASPKRVIRVRRGTDENVVELK